MKWSSLLCCVLIGCATNGPAPAPDDVKPVVQSLSVPALSEALAHQAELASKDPSVDGSELVDGILTKGVEAGIPVSFSDSVRKACTGVGTKPSRDLRADEIAAIRGVTQ